MGELTSDSVAELRSTILIIDDDPLTIALATKVLSQAGHTALGAVGSSEAVEMCDRHPGKIDLIMLDLVLYPPSVHLDSHNNVTPRIHGDKLLPILRLKRPLTRILLMSAMSQWTLGGRGMGHLVRQYPFLQKPLTAETLLQKTREVLGSPFPNR
ncbi:MAG: hypothetical protein ABI856_15705 [Nitrospira sp.]